MRRVFDISNDANIDERCLIAVAVTGNSSRNDTLSSGTLLLFHLLAG